MLSILTTLLSLLITLSIANCSFHWVFSYLSSVSVISAFFDPENWLFFGQKKSTDLALFWSYHEIFFGVITRRFHPDLVNSPLLAWGWASKKALFSVFLVVNILKFDINCTFFLGLFSTYQAKNQKARPWGFAPNPTHLRGRRGMWQNLSTFPWAECWVDSKASRVKCTTASPLTPFHLLGCSKTIRSGRSRKPVKACEATA